MIKQIKKEVHRLLDEYWLIPRAFKKTSKLKIMGSKESVKYIIEQHCSLSRFGDGELDSIEGLGGDYQHPSKRLSSMLLEEFYKLKYCSTVVYMVPRA